MDKAIEKHRTGVSTAVVFRQFSTAMERAVSAQVREGMGIDGGVDDRSIPLGDTTIQPLMYAGVHPSCITVLEQCRPNGHPIAVGRPSRSF